MTAFTYINHNIIDIRNIHLQFGSNYVIIGTKI